MIRVMAASHPRGIILETGQQKKPGSAPGFVCEETAGCLPLPSTLVLHLELGVDHIVLLAFARTRPTRAGCKKPTSG
jgi:hypothetical protein